MLVKAAVIREKGVPFKFEEVEIRQPKGTEVLVKIAGCGVCHTDEVARMQQIPVPLPAVLGHEGSGIVEAVGENVSDLKPGDHVVLTFGSWRECEFCLSGKPFTCNVMNEINFGGVMKNGSQPLSKDNVAISSFFEQSSFATYAIADSSNAVKVDKDVDLALLGPLGCGIQTGAGTVLNCLKPEFGATIVVFGCGGVGLSAIMAAKIIGCSKIIAVDIKDEKLNLALELGATHAINSMEYEDVAGEIKAITGGGANYAVETTGNGSVINTSLYCLKCMGTSAIVGVTGEVTIDIHNALMAEGKKMIGVIEGHSNPKLFIPKLVEYYKAGLFPFDRLIEFYNFEEINEAFEISKKGTVVKPVLKML